MKHIDPKSVAHQKPDNLRTSAPAAAKARTKLVHLVHAALRNGNANLATSLHLLGRRNRRPASVAPLPKIGHRVQDMLAYAMLTMGLSVILLDVGSYNWINGLPGSYYVFFWTFTDLGQAHWWLVPSGLIGLFVLTLDWSRLTRRLTEALHLLFLQVAYIFLVVAVSGIISVVLKWSLGRARPKLSPTSGPTHFDLFAFDSDFTSFPSGHATTVGAIAVALALLIPSWARMIFVLAFWLSASRIMVSAHYPSDVIGGTLLGAAISWYAARYLAGRRLLFSCDQNDRIRQRYSTARYFRHALADLRAMWSKRHLDT